MKRIAILFLGLSLACMSVGCKSANGGKGGTGGRSGAGGMVGAGGAAGTGGVNGAGGAVANNNCAAPTACTTCERGGGQEACPTSLITVAGAVCGDGTGGMVPAFGCDGFLGAARGACTNLLSCIRSKSCMSADDPTPCFCGALTPADCVTQGAPASAPCAHEYAAASIGFPGTVFTQFFDPATPVGIADNLAGCDVDAPCSCP
jgi:hypothetical protein